MSKKHVQPVIHQIANEYKAQLQQLYGNELVELVLFGSHAQGDNHKESDIDFAIILRNPNTRTAAEIAKTSSISSRLSLKYGIMLSSLPIVLIMDVYYCIIALLYTQNVYTKTHQGARAKFAELFIKTAIFPLKYRIQ